ncbi:MAG: PA0069 family radical SAM protein [Alphaproteobacteria bacterium]|nr:PA0069 family radical SAM protein [Alphaproteobacteria bacterium]
MKPRSPSSPGPDIEGFGPAPAEPDAPLAARARKGRGAIGNPASRYDSQTTVAVDDGWGSADDRDAATANPHPDDVDPPRLATTLTRDASRTIIARNTSPDVPFDRSINPYRGCEHGCIYCFARPSHAYLGLSPGLDFETRLLFKPDAAALLRQELAKKSYRCNVMAMGTNTDPYQPVERELKITRSILEVLAAFNHPFTIVTKSALVTRDLDIIAPMAARRLCKIFVSVTTLDRELARTMEPRASTPARRIAAIKALAEAGVHAGVMAAPMIPALNDAELETILEAAQAAGAASAGFVMLRLPYEIKDLFTEWLQAHAPLKAKHVLALIRDMRGGKLNSAEFGERMRGNGPYAELIAKRFRIACARLGLNKNDWSVDITQFKPPARSGDQLRLL